MLLRKLLYTSMEGAHARLNKVNETPIYHGETISSE